MLALGDVQAELSMHDLGQPFDVPIFRVLIRRAIHVQGGLHRAGHHIVEISGQVVSAQHGPAVTVDHFTLLIHDVVVFEQLLPDFEVMGLNLLLRVRDRPRDHAMFDRDAFLHTELEHQLRHPFGREDPH